MTQKGSGHGPVLWANLLTPVDLLKSSSVSKPSLGRGLPYTPVCQQSLSSFQQEAEGWALKGQSENGKSDDFHSNGGPWQIIEKAKCYFESGCRKTYLVERHRKPRVDLIFNSGFSSPAMIKERQINLVLTIPWYAEKGSSASFQFPEYVSTTLAEDQATRLRNNVY